MPIEAAVMRIGLLIKASDAPTASASRLVATAITRMAGNSANAKTWLVTIVTGFFAIAALVALNAHYYFDMTVEMNAPLKITTQIALLCIMISKGSLSFS